MKRACLPILALLCAACAKNIDTQEAVKQGVIKGIGDKVSLGSMDINVSSVSFRGKQADATVTFAPKGGTAQQGLTMQYTMERQGDEWRILSRSQTGMQKHGEQAMPAQQLPAGHPPLDK